MSTFMDCVSVCLALALTAGMAGEARAQLLTAWTASCFDDGNPVGNCINAWLTDVTTGEFVDVDGLTSAALTADNALGRLYSSSGTSISAFAVDANNALVQTASPVRVRNASGVGAEPGQIASLGFARGVLYASVLRSSADAQRDRGLEAGLYAIVPATSAATLLRPASEFPFLPGLDYNPADGQMYGVTGVQPQTIVRFDLDTFTVAAVAEVPPSAYGGVAASFDGLAVGEGKVFLTTGLTTRYGDVPIAVFDLASGAFEAGLPSPPRSAENRSYAAGATFFPAAVGIDPNPGPPGAPSDLLARSLIDGEALLTWGSSRESDFDFYRIFRSVDGLEFVEIGTTTSTTFTDREVGGGITYFYFVTAVDTGGLESAASNVSSVTVAGGSESFIAIASIKPSIKTDAQGRNRGRVAVTVADEAGLPVESASVTVTFSGSFSQTLTGVTNANGRVTLTTSARIAGPVSFEVCVDDVARTGLVYDPTRNVETCDTF